MAGWRAESAARERLARRVALGAPVALRAFMSQKPHRERIAIDGYREALLSSPPDIFVFSQAHPQVVISW